jgi:hypothetical protein
MNPLPTTAISGASRRPAYHAWREVVALDATAASTRSAMPAAAASVPRT